MKNYLWPALCVVLMAVMAVMIFTNNHTNAFFYNDKVFAAFKGKEELENKLKAEQARNKANLDSLADLINSGQTNLQGIYKQTAELAEFREQELLEKYTFDIWKFINDQATKYGKDQGYDFIFGAVGNGSLMYANESCDVTEEFIRYVNEEYQKGD